MPDSAPSYNVSTIHKLLVATFTAEDLRRFCRDRLAFSEIVSRISTRESLEDMVDEVIDYCRTRDLFPQLLSEIERENPSQFARFEPSLRVDSEALAVKILKPGDALLKGKYRIERHLARGGFGSVYLAEETLLHETVAIKELIPALVGDEQALRRFLVEAKTTMRLAHPHVIHTRDLFPEAGNYYMVMEWAVGGSLEDILRDRQTLPVDEIVRIAAEVAEGLAYAHSQGVVHCDLKPGNILFAADTVAGKRGPAKVGDFGVAHVSEHTLTRTWSTGGASVAGTLPYMSPEQTDGVRDDPRVDVYALGAVLYRMLTGRTYVEFDQRDTPRAQAENVRRICSERPVPPSTYDEHIPHWLDKVVLKALAKRPEARFATMDELRAALLRPPRPRARRTPSSGTARSVSTTPVPTQSDAKPNRPLTQEELPANEPSRLPPSGEPPPAELQDGAPPPAPRFERHRRPDALSVRVGEGKGSVEIKSQLPPLAPPVPEAAPSSMAGGSEILIEPPVGDKGQPSSPAPVEQVQPGSRLEPEGGSALALEHPAAAVPAAPTGSALSAAGTKPVGGSLLGCLWRAAGIMLATIAVAILLIKLPDVKIFEKITPSVPPEPTQVPVLPSLTPTSTRTPVPPDPDRIAFDSNRDGDYEIYVMKADGSGQTNVTNDRYNDQYPAWSADGSRIAFTSDRDGNPEIYVMNADGSDQARLTNNPAHDFGPAWSPDGSRIAFESARDGNYEVYVMNADGSGQTRLTDNPAYDYNPDWSPDGEYIAFSSSRDGNNDIYIMNADGSDQIRLTNNPADDWLPAWSPDGKHIAFSSRRNGNWNVYVMNADGSDETGLTDNESVDDYPAWSADGNRIAFRSDRDGNREIYVMNSDGSGQAKLTDNPADDFNPEWAPGPGTSNPAPTWTPLPAAVPALTEAPTLPPTPPGDGHIVFVSVRDGNWEVYLMNADGSGQTRLTNNLAGDTMPALSADGKRVAFTSGRDGNVEIYVMNADGSSQIRLTNNPAKDRLPAWSPDGQHIAFESDRDGNWEIYVMNADGTSPSRLTNNPANDYSPAWSPDGNRIAFYSGRDGNLEIYAMKADGSGQIRLTDDTAADYNPDWSPDGQRIAFSSERDGNWEIYVMNADGSGQTRLTQDPTSDWMPSWSPDGKRIAFEAWRDGNWEIYAMNADGSGQIDLTHNPADDLETDWSR